MCEVVVDALVDVSSTVDVDVPSAESERGEQAARVSVKISKQLSETRKDSGIRNERKRVVCQVVTSGLP
jgi:hypothetical protein